MPTNQTGPETEVARELEGLALGDPRRVARALKIVTAMAKSPEAGFPRIAANESELEGTYRFLRNPEIKPTALLEPHHSQTAMRASDAKVVVVAHDTTSFEFSGVDQAEEMGYLNTSARGFYAHMSFVLNAAAVKEPLGVIASRVWFRAKPPRRRGSKKKRSLNGGECAKLKRRESARWLEQVEESESRLRQAKEDIEAIHVMDREADSYDLLANLFLNKRRFVVRMARDRVATDYTESVHWAHVRALLGEVEAVLSREVPLGRRRKKTAPRATKDHTPRQARTAKLRYAAAQIAIKRPPYLKAPVPSILPLNAVRIYEVEVPDGVEPVEWVLFTTESVDTADQIATVVDYYRGRWMIEELFKAIKTGCAYEKRQLESRRTLLNALALTIPVAWQLLLLRGVARTTPDGAATVVLTARQVKVLRACAKIPMSPNPTLREALLVLGRLGGYLRSNGEPGWRSLSRGMEKLLAYEVGWLAALEQGNVGKDPTIDG